MLASRKKFPQNIVMILTVISFFSKMFGYLRDVVLSSIYGVSYVADAFVATLAVPEMFLDILANTTALGFVPIFLEKLNSDQESANSFSSSYVKAILLFATFIFAVMQLYTQGLISVLVPGFTGETFNTAVIFLKILSIMLFFRAISSVMNAYLHGKKVFVPGSFLGILLDVLIIAMIVLSKKVENIYLMPIGALLGTVFQAVWLFPFVKKAGWKFYARASIFTSDIASVLKRIVPIMLSVGLMQISTLVNRSLASSIAEGGIMLISNASRISYIIENIIVASLGSVLYPYLVEYNLKNENKLFCETVQTAVNKLLVILVPAATGLAIVSLPLTNLVFGHGVYTDENVRDTAMLMILHVIGIPGIAIQTFMTRVMFAVNKIKKSAIVSISLLIIYVLCSVVCAQTWGLAGIALATGLSYTIGGIVYYIVVTQLCKGIEYKKTLLVLAKTALASGVMTIVLLIIRKFIDLPNLIELIVFASLGIILFFGTARLLQLKEANIKELLKVYVKSKK